MGLFDNALRKIDQGREGGNEGLPMGFERLVQFVPNLQLGTYYLIVAGTGVGKCLALGTKVIMYDGRLKAVEEIVVGDQLMGPDSAPRNVLALGSGVDQMYWVRQKRGIDYKVNSQHILSLSKRPRTKYRSYILPGQEHLPKHQRKRGFTDAYTTATEILNIPILDAAKKPSHFFTKHKGWKAKGIELPLQSFPLDPYFFGLWLGDGSSADAAITNIEPEIQAYISTIAEANGCHIRQEHITANIAGKRKRETKQFSLSDELVAVHEGVTEAALAVGKHPPNIARAVRDNKPCAGFMWQINRYAKNTFLAALQGLNVLRNKHIPDCYLYNCREVRLAVLAGFIDTDGYFGKGCYEITQKSRVLAEQLVYLTRSLGFSTSIREKEATMRRKDNSIYRCNVYRVVFGGAGLNEIPCRVERKKAPVTTRTTDALVTDIRIEKAEVGTYYGFQIDGDHLFLLEDFTVTHNTAVTDQAFMYEPFEYIMSLGEETDIELDIDYFSYEIDSTVKITKGISRRLYQKYGLIADVNFILSKGKNRISQEIYDLTLAERVYFEELEKRLHVFDMPENPTGVNKYLRNKSAQHGKEVFKEIDTVDDQGNPAKRTVFSHYVPNNPKRYHIGIVDHASLSKQEKGMGTKDTIDKLSQYFVQWRNNYSGIPVMVQQLSFDNFSSDRAKLRKVTPTLGDLGDSKYTGRDCNVALSLFSPMAMDLPKFMEGPGHNGYNINRLQDNFRSLEILKGRDGGVGTRIGLQYVGAAGVFKELPRPMDMTEADYARVAALK